MTEKSFEDRIAAARPNGTEGDEIEVNARSRAHSLLRAEIARTNERSLTAGRRRFVLRVAFAVAALAALTLIGLDLGLPGRADKSGPTIAVAATLEQFAQLVAGAPNEPLQSGQYYYVQTLTGSGERATRSPSGKPNGQAEEIWIGTDGSGRVLTPGPYGQDEHYGPDLTVDNVHLTYAGLLALPIRPLALRRWLQMKAKGAGPEVVDVQLGMIAELLGRTPAPPALRAALYRVLNDFAGIKPEGRVRDPLGRSGVGFKRHMAGCELQPEATCDWEIILDPKTGNWLADRRYLSNGGPYWEATVESGVVDSMFERP
jgi:hypothetical protein